MRRPSRTVVGYALLFAVPSGAGLGVAVETVGGDTSLAVLSAVAAAVGLFVGLVVLFSAGSVEA